MYFLVADDDPVHRTVLGRMIERLGYPVDVVKDGTEAVASAQVREYDVIILDIFMPGVDGLEAARAIRAASAQSRGPFIIALTAGPNGRLRGECMDAGMDSFLTKPARLETLKDAIESISAPISGDSSARAHDWALNTVTVASPSDDAEPILDMDVLRRFRSMMGAEDQEFIREIEADFVQDAGTLAHAIERAGTTEEHEAMARAAHALKSNSAMFGATRLSSVARSLERLADAGLPHPWIPLHRRLVAEIDEVRVALSTSAFSRT